jgi:hypothetical protein
MEGLALGLGTAVAEGIATNQVVSAVTNETVQMSPQTKETTKWRTLRPSIHANNHGEKNFMQHVLSSEPVEQLIHHF